MLISRQRSVPARVLTWLAVVAALVLPVPQHSHIEGLAGHGAGVPALERATTAAGHHDPGRCLACATGPRATIAPTVVADLPCDALRFGTVPDPATPRPAAIPRDGAARGPPSSFDIA